MDEELQFLYNMEKLKHTPGPWKLLTEGDEDTCIVRTVMGPGNQPRNLSEVALVTTGSYPDDVEEANARLIAAAPDLLEALQVIRDSFWSEGEPLQERIDVLKEMAAEAIKKVTNGTN